MRGVIISARQVVKRYGSTLAIDGLSVEIPYGRVFGLLGPNGAGKTTLLRLMMGLARPDSGQIRLLDGHAPGSPQAVQGIGYMPQQLALYESLTVLENVLFFGRLYGVAGPLLRERAHAALQQVQLEGQRDTRAGALSGGMMRRAMLATATIHHPRLLILDEPTAGVDPLLRVRFWDWFEQLAEGGTTILVTTHHIEEASRCQEVLFLRAGRLLARGAPALLMRHYGCADLEAAFVRATVEWQAGHPGIAEAAVGESAGDAP